MATRVTAGTKKGMRIDNPPKGTRPLTDRIKISLFDLIKDFIPNSHVADLFAGGGNFGIEALSRGARNATFVDLSKDSIELIKSNLSRVGFESNAKVIRSDVYRFIEETRELFDIVMLDPPFDEYSYHALEGVEQIVKPDGLLILRYPSLDSAPKNFGNFKATYTKKYGVSSISFYQSN